MGLQFWFKLLYNRNSTIRSRCGKNSEECKVNKYCWEGVLTQGWGQNSHIVLNESI